MDYLDRYKKRVSHNGSSFKESIKNSSEDFFNHNFTSSPNHRVAIVNGEHEEDIRVSNTELAAKKRLAVRPGKVFKNGDLFFFDETYWLVVGFSIYHTSPVAYVVLCNGEFKFKFNNKLYTIPAVMDNRTLYNIGLVFRSHITYGDTIMNVMLPNSKETKLIYRNMRFLVKSNSETLAYKITYMDDTMEGLLVAQSSETLIMPEDDTENCIAFNNDFLQEESNSDIEIIGPTILKLGEEQMYSINIEGDFIFSIDSPEYAKILLSDSTNCKIQGTVRRQYISLIATNKKNKEIAICKNILIV